MFPVLTLQDSVNGVLADAVLVSHARHQSDFPSASRVTPSNLLFSPEKFALDARELARQGVPFRHQGCDPSTGIDCINVLRFLYRKQGCLLPEEIEEAFKAYHPKTNGKEMFRLMLKWLIPVEIGEAKIGDVYLFREKKDARHTAIKVTDDEPPFIVEAYTNKLMDWRLTFVRWRLIVAAFRIPGEMVA